MATFKCKMCGGTIEFNQGDSVGVCDSCGTKQTLPKTGDDVIANLFNRANNLRLKCEFDKAAQIYEKIVQQDDSEAEAHWGIVLCKYGIEYVEDPKTFQRIPTCHRTLFEAVTTDADYLAAVDYSDTLQQQIYESEARAIDKIQKDILAIVKNEKPFDVFICYKETDDSGKRTIDSTIANDIYYQLTQQGFKVFFAAITLEDKLGQEYEPYIFAALNSAKVMLVLGTKPEYFSAVWVKNEWSRYLQLMRSDRSKLLIPCYRDMDAYDLPEEFAHLQAQDMSKIGFINDIVRGINKVAQVEEPQTTVVKETVVSTGGAQTAPLLERAFMFLEDGDWSSADEYCEKVLDLDPKCARAYLGKLMAELQVKRQDELKDLPQPFDSYANYEKTIRFADDGMKTVLQDYIVFIVNRNSSNMYENAIKVMNSATTEAGFKYAADVFKKIAGFRDARELFEKCLAFAENTRLDDLYQAANDVMEKANTENEYRNAAEKFKLISEYKNSAILAQECIDKAETIWKDGVLDSARRSIEKNPECDYSMVISELEAIAGWKDADQLISLCQKTIQEKHQEEMRFSKQMNRIAFLVIGVVLLLAIIISLGGIIRSHNKYKTAIELMGSEKYTEAIEAFKSLGAYKDSSVKIKDCKYLEAVALIDAGKYTEAIDAFNALDGYKDSSAKAEYIYGEYKLEKLKKAQIDDVVIFGTYEQDNNAENGKEEIKWLVLERRDNQMLLISKYALDCQKYNSKYEDITWEKCTLRSWLNGSFINTAFSDEEKGMIPTVTVSADKNLASSTDPGNATQDKVFLLSIPEVNKYFKSDIARQCIPTVYAVAQGVSKNSSGNCWWWLRSPGGYQKHATLVDRVGDVDEGGDFVDFDAYAVRPACWIDISE